MHYKPPIIKPGDLIRLKKDWANSFQKLFLKKGSHLLVASVLWRPDSFGFRFQAIIKDGSIKDFECVTLKDFELVRKAKKG